MEEKLLETELDLSNKEMAEPITIENSSVENSNSISLEKSEINNTGESVEDIDPSINKILGKFKSVEELTKAYEELQKHQGRCSDELGTLRKELASVKNIQETFKTLNTMQNEFVKIIERDREKYNSPEYFQDPTFREIYKEALGIFGENLDTEKLVNLLEAYATARIFANDKKRSANDETQKVIDSMTYDKNPKSSFSPPQKRFDEMTDKEVDELLERLI